MKRGFILFLIVLILPFSAFAQGANGVLNKGLWVSVFSKGKVLYSKEAVIKLIDTCKRSGINQIYLQVYQSGNAYYNTKIADRTKYEDLVKAAGVDTIDFLLQEAAKNNIKVFAWVNLLSLGQNENAYILKKFGSDILTRDQYGRPSGRKDANDSDKYFLREEQIFLEPGDERVAKQLITITEEIIYRYPAFSGVHLDYARYPMTVPFIPGSRFTKQGLTYGYGKKNVEHFKWIEGQDPLSGLETDVDYFKWDQWRRNQITSLIKRISTHVKKRSPGILVSCAVIPASERAYASMFQDWPYWLEEGLLDYVVLMNYSQDNQLSKEIVKSALGLRDKGKVFIGIGAFLIKDNQRILEQYKIVKKLNPDGIVLFSYDDITDELADSIGQIK
ncbi:MAG: family 10 glycosylhydrolase [Candidatus Omnitrophica bacterium]|nr:family 10 glycosylhydrolase [Candidatus Omnitrophota bacterium]